MKIAFLILATLLCGCVSQPSQSPPSPLAATPAAAASFIHQTRLTRAAAPDVVTPPVLTVITLAWNFTDAPVKLAPFVTKIHFATNLSQSLPWPVVATVADAPANSVTLTNTSPQGFFRAESAVAP